MNRISAKILPVLTLLTVYHFSAAQSKSVLFVGNSYTAGLPQLVSQVALSAGDTLLAIENAAGGQTLSGHASNDQLYDQLRNEDFDYVVLQAQSQECSFPDGQVATQVFPYAKQLCDSIHLKPCSIPMFYMTWGRKNGDAQNCSVWPPVCTYKGMDSIIYDNYQKMGDDNYAEVSPAGAVWRWIRENAPSIDLYSGDGSHPNSIGSMATAYTFYSAIYRKSPSGATFSGGIPQAYIDTIKMAVNAVLMDEMSLFNIGVNNPNASFTTDKSGCTLNVTPAVLSNDNYLWDFGDGSTSKSANTTHTYQDKGEYTVKLSTIKCGITTTDSLKFTCGTNGMKDLSSDLNVFPNPTTGIVNIPAHYSLVSVRNLIGQVLSFRNNGNSTVTISDKGVILIELLDKGGQQVFKKIVVQ